MGVGSHALTEALSPPTAFYLSQAASPAYARLLHAGFFGLRQSLSKPVSARVHS